MIAAADSVLSKRSASKGPAARMAVARRVAGPPARRAAPRILDWTGRPMAPAPGRNYDAAATNRFNQAHWLDADGSDADHWIRESVETLRARTRYEIRNNGYARGIVRTHAADVVGTGPRLQILPDAGADMPADDADAAATTAWDAAEAARSVVEDDFSAWAARAEITGRSLAQVLALAVKEFHASGEAFIVVMSAPDAAPDAVALRLRVVEADRVATPIGLYGSARTDNVRDGIEYDDLGRPRAYYVARRHPGDTTTSLALDGYDRVPAADMIHIFEQDRPEQGRGCPWMQSSLNPLASLRRYTLATLSSAEIAADIVGVLETAVEDLDPESVESEAFDPVEIERGHLMTLPLGQKAHPFETNRPETTYPAFKHEILKELGRPCGMPYTVVAGDSTEANYASGRLDKQTYYKLIEVLRALELAPHIDRVLDAWYREYRLLRAAAIRAPRTPRHVWYWDGFPHVDPVKEAAAQDSRLANHSTTHAREYGEAGLDWRREIDQAAAEVAYKRRRGLVAAAAPVEGLAALLAADAEDKPDE